ncbi:hypothetical protein [Vibrio harveyi]|uniref:hypothetical protein n=1 Tax=Vibrio harveyi TaxID=669 RepID=UPI003D726F03
MFNFDLFNKRKLLELENQLNQALREIDSLKSDLLHLERENDSLKKNDLPYAIKTAARVCTSISSDPIKNRIEENRPVGHAVKADVPIAVQGGELTGVGLAYLSIGMSCNDSGD